MEIYLDLTLLSLILNSIISLYFIKIVSLKKIKIRFYILISIISSLEILYFYHNFYLLFFIIFILYGFVFYLFLKKEFLLNLLLFLMFKNLIQLIMMISFNLFRFYNGLFYINNKNNLIFFLFYPVVFVLIFLVSIFVDKSFHLNHFKEKVILILNNKKYQVEAYFDSGNVLLYNRIPVIFMVENKCPIDKKDFNIEIFAKTINGNKIYFAKEVLILVDGKKEYKYSYLCLVNKESFNGCELLLNAYLF